LGDFDERDSEVAFEWVSLGAFPLTTKAEIPKTPWRILPCYGTIHRTLDYPTIDVFDYRHIAEHISPVYVATKIGGIAPWIQPEEDIPGTFLCALNSIWAEIDEPFPFLNVPEPISYEDWDKSRALMIGDVGRCLSSSIATATCVGRRRAIDVGAPSHALILLSGIIPAYTWSVKQTVGTSPLNAQQAMLL
jgi:hypothetical protein